MSSISTPCSAEDLPSVSNSMVPYEGTDNVTSKNPCTPSAPTVHLAPSLLCASQRYTHFLPQKPFVSVSTVHPAPQTLANGSTGSHNATFSVLIGRLLLSAAPTAYQASQSPLVSSSAAAHKSTTTVPHGSVFSAQQVSGYSRQKEHSIQAHPQVHSSVCFSGQQYRMTHPRDSGALVLARQKVLPLLWSELLGDFTSRNQISVMRFRYFGLLLPFLFLHPRLLHPKLISYASLVDMRFFQHMLCIRHRGAWSPSLKLFH